MTSRVWMAMGARPVRVTAGVAVEKSAPLLLVMVTVLVSSEAARLAR